MMDNFVLYQNLMKIYYDIQSTIYLSRDHLHNERTKHIDVRFHFICDIIEDGDIKLIKVDTKDNPANMLIKVVSNSKHKRCMKLIQVLDIMI